MSITSIAIVAIICWAIVSLFNGSKKNAKSSKQDNLEKDALKNDIQSLKDRIANLEAIITDEKYDLKREFDNLNKNDAA